MTKQQDPTPVYQRIDHFISVGDYASARDELNSIIPTADAHYSEDFNYGGFAIDIGDGLGEPSLIKTGIKYTEMALSRIPDTSPEYGSALFNHANGLDSLFKNTHERVGLYVGHEEIEAIKSAYRKAISHSAFDPKHHVNYGNLLNGQLGRSIEALEEFDRGIALKPNHALALANRGYTKFSLAKVVSNEAGTIILHEVYSDIQQAFEQGMDAKPSRFFTELRTHIKSLFADPSILEDPMQSKSALPADEESLESFYIKFCHQHQLYLNPLGRAHSSIAALGDPLVLSGFIESIQNPRKSFYEFSNYLNLIKQEYVSARFLAALSHYRSGYDFVDSNVLLVDTLDYQAFNIYIEQAKNAFRVCYSILDKLALLVNRYLELGLKEDQVYFRSISNLKSKSALNQFYPFRNKYLAALVDLSNDFENGYFQEFRLIRRLLEHRFYTIKHEVSDAESSDDHIVLTPAHFREKLIELLKVVRSAIFYGLLMINEGEQQKYQELEGVKVVPMPSMSIPDDLKKE